MSQWLGVGEKGKRLVETSLVVGGGSDEDNIRQDGSIGYLDVIDETERGREG